MKCPVWLRRFGHTIDGWLDNPLIRGSIRHLNLGIGVGFLISSIFVPTASSLTLWLWGFIVGENIAFWVANLFKPKTVVVRVRLLVDGNLLMDKIHDVGLDGGTVEIGLASKYPESIDRTFRVQPPSVN